MVVEDTPPPLPPPPTPTDKTIPFILGLNPMWKLTPPPPIPNGVNLMISSRCGSSDPYDVRAINLDNELCSIKIGKMTVNKYCTKIQAMANRLKNLDLRNMLLLKESSFNNDSTSTTFESSSSSPTLLMAISASDNKDKTPNLPQLCNHFNKGTCKFGDSQSILGATPALHPSQATSLPSAFSTMSLQDPTWNMDTAHVIFIQSPSLQISLLSLCLTAPPLGNLGDEVLRSLTSHRFISCNKEKSSHIFHACQLGKHVKLSFHSSDSIVTKCCDIIHLICGPLPIDEFPLPEDFPTASEERFSQLRKSSYCNIVYRTPCPIKGVLRNDVKARTTLLLALPDEHQLRFIKYKTAQELWAAILKTFGGNKATKKTKKNRLKHQYGNFKAEGSETLEQTFNRLQAIRNRGELDTMILDDVYNHLKVYEPEVQKKSESNSQNMAFISSAKNSTTSISLDTAFAYIASQSNGSQIKYEDINQIDEDDIEEMDIKWNMALLSMRADKFWKKTEKKISIQCTDVAGFDKSKVEESAPKALMEIDGVGCDWSYMENEEEDHALVADQEAPTEFTLMAKFSYDTEVFDNSLCSKACKKNTDSLNTNITELSEKLGDTKTTLCHYKLGLSQVKARLVEFKNQEIKFCKKIRGLEFKVESKTNRIESLTNELEMLKKEKEGLDSKLTGFQSTSKDLDTLLGSHRPSPSIESNDLQNNSSSVSKNGESTSSILSKPEIKFVKAADSPTVIKTNKDKTVRKPFVKYAEMYRKTSKSSNVRGNQRNWNNLKSQQLGKNFLMKNKACFNYGDFDHLSYDYGKWVEKGKSRPKNNTHKSIPPRTVFHKSDRSPTRTTRPNMNATQPTRTYFYKPVHSYVKRPFQRTSAVRTQFRVPRVSTVNRKFPTVNRKFLTGNSKLSTSDLGNKGKAVKASACWIWKPKQNSTDKGPNSNSGNSQNVIDNKGYWDSGCSRHITGNISYLSDYEPYDGGYVSFGQGGCKITDKGTIKTGKLEFENVYFIKDLKYNLFSVSQICDNKNSVLFIDSECIVLGRNFKLKDDTNVLLRTPRQHNMYSIDLNNIVPHKDLTCLVAKASADESLLWHRRLGHLNFKTMNRLVRHNLVKGLPFKCFDNDHTCVACLKGKQHKASCKTKFTWTFFLKTKDETSGILWNFITEIENLKDFKVKIIRCDNGREFKNKEMNDFCLRKGIKREFNNARTPQQNRVSERRNRTLIEAARTMLADAKLSVTFWAEAVNTACYVQNRVLVNKSQNKTPYELFNGRSPDIGFLKPFGCHVMILITLDHLGKFEAKGDEGYFIGYSMSSKAFRVFNKRIKIVEDNLHVDFLENKLIEKGAGPNWLFDIDTLANSMNYVSVVSAGTTSTNFSGTKDVASQDVKKDVSSLRYIALPNWFHEAHLESSISNAQDAYKANAPESSRNSYPTATSTNPPADQIETLTVETPIPIVSSLVPTACLDDSPQLSSDTRLISKRVTSQDDTPSLDNILTLTNKFEDILGVTINTGDTNGLEADLSNMENNISASPTSTLRIHKDHPTRVRPIGTKWVLKNKKDERGIVIKNKARLVAQGHTHEKGIDYEEVFASVTRIEAIRLFLAYASFMRFTFYQIDVKSSFLYGTIDEEVYVMQPPGFQDPEFPARVYKLEKATYGLHQAPRAWYGTLFKYLLTNGFQRGTIDQTLFIQKHRGDFLFVQVYVDDIIFGSSNPQLCRKFEALMHEKFQMSAMGELNFFLGLSVNTPIDKENPWGKDETGKDVDLHLYRSMIEYLMYLTASRPDIMFAVCACARHQYPKESPFDLVAYSDSDYGGATPHRKSTTRGCQFLGRRLISWQCKKQTIMATSTTESEYVAAASGCGQALWIQNQLLDYGHHFIRDCFEKKLISVDHNHTDDNVADLLTKPFDAGRLAFYDYHNMIAILEKYEHNVDFHPIMDFVKTSYIRVETSDEGTKILATVDGKPRTISKSSIMRNLKLKDEAGISSLPDAKLFKKLTLMGYNTSPNQKFTFQKATNRVYNFSKMIFDGMVRNVNNKVSTILMYPRRARIVQSSALSTAADEPASPFGDDSQGEACLTVSGLEAEQDMANIIKTSTLPHDSLPRVTSFAADEGSMQHQLNELTDLCTRLQRQQTEMAFKITAQDLEIASLKARIKLLEDKDRGGDEPSREDATIKGRSLETGEEAAVEKSIERGKVSTVCVPTASGMVPTASLIFTTASVVTPYSRRKGKEKMVESDTPKKKKLREQIDVQMAREMEEQLAREDQRMSEQIARDAEIARIHAKEELQMLIDSFDRNNETTAKYLQEYVQFAADLDIGERIELINDLKKSEKKFILVWKQIEDFVPMGSKEEGERVKRKGLRLEHESAKKVKTSEKVSEEDLKTMMQLVPVEEHLDREDLNQLWALVRETLNIRQAKSDKEKELWVELKRLYEPDVEDQPWTQTQALMHDPVEWRRYDTCSVHHVLLRDQEIFMLVEKEYPLRKGLAIVMISNKLQVENYSQMANDLIQKIYKIANSPRQRDD
uniref:Integrase catalytic domain-containing protein n=1 Tax=Tanacetum cinerariifolium TaxID=118510 RepID=A0A6L2LU51_TANCI|nr:hypothetical protein [Tanacetum cinerariifolium]